MDKIVQRAWDRRIFNKDKKNAKTASAKSGNLITSSASRGGVVE